MDNDNNLNLHSMTKLSDWLRLDIGFIDFTGYSNCDYCNSETFIFGLCFLLYYLKSLSGSGFCGLAHDH